MERCALKNESGQPMITTHDDDSSFPFDDDNLDIPGYIIIRVDHPANGKRGGVCMYY